MGRKRKKSRRSREDEYYGAGLSDGTRRGLWILVLFGLVLLLGFSFFGFAGVMGAWIDSILAIGFGWARVGIPMVILAVIYYLIKTTRYKI